MHREFNQEQLVCSIVPLSTHDGELGVSMGFIQDFMGKVNMHEILEPCRDFGQALEKILDTGHPQPPDSWSDLEKSRQAALVEVLINYLQMMGRGPAMKSQGSGAGGEEDGYDGEEEEEE